MLSHYFHCKDKVPPSHVVQNTVEDEQKTRAVEWKESQGERRVWSNGANLKGNKRLGWSNGKNLKGKGTCGRMERISRGTKDSDGRVNRMGESRAVE